MNGELSLSDFAPLHSLLSDSSIPLTPSTFRSLYLSPYSPSSSTTLPFSGFLRLFLDLSATGRALPLLRSLGYHPHLSLQQDTFSLFVLTMHSDRELQYEVMSGCEWVEQRASELVVERDGRQIYENGPLQVICAYNE